MFKVSTGKVQEPAVRELLKQLLKKVYWCMCIGKIFHQLFVAYYNIKTALF